MLNPEHQFREWATAKGWKVSKRGWPDFICQYDGAVIAVEVKGPRDGLMPEQHEVLCALNAIGMPTYVWTPEFGLSPYPATPVKESISSLKAYISELEAVIRDLTATKDAEMAATLRALAATRKLDRTHHKQSVAQQKVALGPEAYAAKRAARRRYAEQLTDPALIVLHGDHLDLR